ncbi:uncharacterized protein EV420DRAFT_1486366 [Desarmillaria tabescens]|uniref:Secreted protein n=1 Tax=Armillaria tabescens TaxID=1929756 RepID=A0AA39JCD8_ARMTA|nr:uncharacterized protein EV420DRAFT_1486366 [Desarmillaria tabescens]KAK0439452.1 hypothetical protein EV420DRAFT_1486366 [Desarmillaria tabescens]
MWLLSFCWALEVKLVRGPRTSTNTTVIHTLQWQSFYLSGGHEESGDDKPVGNSGRLGMHLRTNGMSAKQDVHRIRTTVGTYGGYGYGPVPWPPSTTQNTAVFIRLEYGHRGSGQGWSNTIEIFVVTVKLSVYGQRYGCGTDLKSTVPYREQEF